MWVKAKYELAASSLPYLALAEKRLSMNAAQAVQFSNPIQNQMTAWLQELSVWIEGALEFTA